MRYIADSSGYVKQVSFGADIVCDGQHCTEYVGAVPTGYKSLEEWYLAEVEKLYRWKIVDGNLTLDSTTEAPSDFSVLEFCRAVKEYFALKNQMLIELSSDWKSGTKTVPNVSKYETIEVFPHATVGGMICRLEPDGKFRGSGWVQGVSTAFVQYEFAFSVSGDDLTISQCRYGGRSGTTIWTPETAMIRRIRGVEPKLPAALKSLI